MSPGNVASARAADAALRLYSGCDGACRLVM
jgi:hypothetical protein